MRTTTLQAWRLSFYFGAVFAVVGVMAPFWPVFLKARGLSATEIGLVLSAGLWLRVILNPLIAQLADRRGERRRPLMLLSVLAMLGFSGFLLAHGFWGLLAVNLIASVAFSSIMPLGETVVLGAVYRLGLDYGRLRIWGSLTFIATSAAGGPMLAAFGSWSVLWAILALMAVVLAACALLPGEYAADERAPPRAKAPMRLLLRQPVFLFFLLAGGLGNASHAVLYGFATLHWRSVGFSDAVIGALWAEGVVAEIILFWLGNRLLSRFGAANLLALGAAGILRWTAMGLSDGLWLALLTQALHAFTFGAAHLGAMHFIARAAPPDISATAQSLHGAVGAGIAVGLAMAFAGLLYQAFASGAFFFMAAIATVSLLAALLLARTWDGGRMNLS